MNQFNPYMLQNLGLGASPFMQQPGLDMQAYPQMVQGMQQNPMQALQGGLLQQQLQQQPMGGFNKGMLGSTLLQYGMQGLL